MADSVRFMGQWFSQTFGPDGGFDRGAYRIVCPILFGVALAVLVATGDDGRVPLGPGLMLSAIYVLLILLTVRRLRDAGMSALWIAFMIITIHVGPTWRVSSTIEFQAGGLLTLIPVMIGLVARRAEREAPVLA